MRSLHYQLSRVECYGRPRPISRLHRDFEEPTVEVAILEALQKLGYDRPTQDQALAARNFVLGYRNATDGKRQVIVLRFSALPAFLTVCGELLERRTLTTALLVPSCHHRLRHTHSRNTRNSNTVQWSAAVPCNIYGCTTVYKSHLATRGFHLLAPINTCIPFMSAWTPTNFTSRTFPEFSGWA